MPEIVHATTEAIFRAAQIIRDGGIVAFPTETVYGLGGNALDAMAVARIFEAKGRPATNPVIVHIADVADLPRIALVTETAQRLAAAFWPGPLTLVLPKTDAVPAIVTAGGATVGVRIPSHPVALALIRQAGVPIAAPSANRSEQISPTRAEHVALSLGERVELILDGGPCQVGIESTVLDLTGNIPRILRPGMIGATQIEECLGGSVLARPQAAPALARSPGMMPRHYAPRTPAVLVGTADIGATLQVGDACLVYSADAIAATHATPRTIVSNAPTEYAAQLYEALHRIDSLPGVTRIVIEQPPATPEWTAIDDRLRRATHGVGVCEECPKVPRSPDRS